jgi:hypothetical protein
MKQSSLVVLFPLSNVLQLFTNMLTHVREFLWATKLIEK